jgi:outer membrane protein
VQVVFATSLWEVYQQALKSDPTFQAAWAKQMAEAEALPQSQAKLLPQIGFSSYADWGESCYETSGGISTLPAGKVTWKQRGHGFDFHLTQEIFNLSDWKDLSVAKNSVKASIATYNAAYQQLIQRTINAYLSVLQAREVLRFTEAEKQALYSDYQRVYQSFKVGLKTITDVYNARAAYDEAIARYVTAKNDLANSKEDLRSITGVLYNDLDWLKQSFPLVRPSPADVDQWVSTAVQQNWKLMSARFATFAARDRIQAARVDHLPTVNVSAQYNNDYVHVTDFGYERQRGPVATVNLELPIFSGGTVTSLVRQAIAEYQLTSSQQEQVYRQVLNDARKAYLGVLSDISQVDADRQTIISNRSSLEGMQEGYKVGVRTIVDVLDAEKALYESQKNYAVDRYSYIRNSINLKLAAGTLSEKDLLSINRWLGRTICTKNCKE